MKLSDFVDGTCDRPPCHSPSNKDILRFLLSHKENHAHVDLLLVEVSHLIISHYSTIEMYRQTDFFQPCTIVR